MRLLNLYSTTDGQTHKIARFISEKLAHADITMSNLDDFMCEPLDLDEFDVVLLGASIRYGSHKKSVTQFIDRFQDTLRDKTFAFYSVNLTARKPEKATPETSAYSKKMYAKIPVHPDIDAVFAGKLDYPKYNFFDRNMIRFIMKITGGPTDPKIVKEYTDWDAVSAFAQKLGE